MRAILYSRVSTADQAVNGHSLDAQERALRSYAAFKGFDDVELVVDAGLSGGTTDRPGFKQVMDAVQSKNVDAVVVYSLSRFARNTVATVEAVELMNRRGVAFHSLSEQIDTTTAVGRFFVTTLAALAQLEREQVGERTRAILLHKKLNGERVGQIPFGFHLSGEQVVPDEREQHVIATVRDLRTGGMTYREIANYLTRHNIQNKNGGTKWFTSQVHRMLRAA